MASYTMQLRDYIESFSQDNIDNMKWADIIETGRTKLFDFDYPLYDENYRKDFETHFIRNFYMREIGFETEGLFKFQLETWLNINMPYWNKMYESELLSYNPLNNTTVDITHHKTNDKSQNDTNDSTFSGTSNGTKSSTNNQSKNGSVTEDNFNRMLHSDNPDTRLELTATDGTGVIEYANEIEENNANNSTTKTDTLSGNSSDTRNDTSSGSSNNTLNSTVDETEDFTQHREGKIGVQTFAKMIQEHRDIFLRIDKMIFKEMNELFMLVY